MTFHAADISKSEFWNALKLGVLDGDVLPRPDVLHASPPCAAFSRLARTRLSSEEEVTTDSVRDLSVINELIVQVKDFQQFLLAKDGRPLIWQIENVPESRPYVQVPVVSTSLLCGTMMGHQLFRHRLLYSNYPLAVPERHSHDGKHRPGSGVSSNTLGRAQYFGAPTWNMYGAYSQPPVSRQTANEWHGALGALPGTYSARGIAGCLPTGYGRLTASQMIAHSLHGEYGCPVWPRHKVSPLDALCLARWARVGYKPIRHELDECVTVRALMEPASGAPPNSLLAVTPVETVPECPLESPPPLHLSE